MNRYRNSEATNVDTHKREVTKLSFCRTTRSNGSRTKGNATLPRAIALNRSLNDVLAFREYGETQIRRNGIMDTLIKARASEFTRRPANRRRPTTTYFRAPIILAIRRCVAYYEATTMTTTTHRTSSVLLLRHCAALSADTAVIRDNVPLPYARLLRLTTFKFH